MRVPTLHTHRQALDAIEARQSQQARLVAQVASGLRIQSPGDDPAAAAQAELARSRLAHLAQDQRAQQLAGSVLSVAEGSLAQGIEWLQRARERLVAAGNGGYGPSERQALALELRATLASLQQLANARDGAGGFVFAGQGSAGEPMPAGSPPAYEAAAGTQRIGEGGRYAASIDGRATFLALPQGNGVFVTASSPGNAGTGWIDIGSVSDPSQLTGHAYAVVIGGMPGALTYSVTDETTGTAVASNLPFAAGSTIDVEGQRVRIAGVPAAGDRFTLGAAGQQSVFETLEQAIGLLEDRSVAAGAYDERLQRVQASLDRALEGMVTMRSRVGAELVAVEDAAVTSRDAELSVTRRRSDLQDLDLARAIEQLQTAQTGAEAALKTYSSIARTSLFDLLR